MYVAHKCNIKLIKKLTNQGNKQYFICHFYSVQIWYIFYCNGNIFTVFYTVIEYFKTSDPSTQILHLNHHSQRLYRYNAEQFGSVHFSQLDP